jgi:hypothetical protein
MPIPLGDLNKDRPVQRVERDGTILYWHRGEWVSCDHDRRKTTYTRQPCVCGRPLWPPRGRGRGESLLSPRRAQVWLRTGDMYSDYWRGMSWRKIAKKYGYAGPSGAWQAVYRHRDAVPGSRTGYRAPNMKRAWRILNEIGAEVQAIQAGEPERLKETK